MNKLDFILNELSKIPENQKLNKKETGSILVLCPYHEDSTPSFSINVDETKRKIPLGYGRCWSCGGKAVWNKFAGQLHLKTMDGAVSDDYFRRLDTRDKNRIFGKTSALSWDQINNEFKCYISYPIDEDETWRGFSGKFLSRFNMRMSADEFGKSCVLVPVIIDGEIQGAVKAFSKKSKNKKITSYLNYSGEWIKEFGLFPYDYVMELIERKNLNYVIICEGLRDALTLLKLGYPALCIFGTQTFTDRKLERLKILGVDTLVVMMDAGKSGIAATNTILEKTRGKGLKRIIVKMQEWQTRYEKKLGQPLGYEIDPNNCPKDLMKKILKWLNKEINS